jgi:WD40 repeat protein
MQFSADKVHVVSGSDDGTVRVWDVAVGEEVNRLVGHTDYVRAVAASPQGPEIFASGGYDHMCRIWDVRTQQYVGRPPSESLRTWPLRVHPAQHTDDLVTAKGSAARSPREAHRVGRTGAWLRERSGTAERYMSTLHEYDDLD